MKTLMMLIGGIAISTSALAEPFWDGSREYSAFWGDPAYAHIQPSDLKREETLKSQSGVGDRDTDRDVVDYLLNDTDFDRDR